MVIIPSLVIYCFTSTDKILPGYYLHLQYTMETITEGLSSSFSCHINCLLLLWNSALPPGNPPDHYIPSQNINLIFILVCVKSYGLLQTGLFKDKPNFGEGLLFRAWFLTFYSKIVHQNAPSSIGDPFIPS